MEPHVTCSQLAVDGGAHRGIFTRLLGPHFGRIVAFEPHRPHAAICAELPGVEVHALALGSVAGTMALEPGAETDGQWHLAEGRGVVVVPLDLLDLEGVGLLKLDVEGYELPALKGAERTIESYRPVVVIEENGLCRRYGVEEGEAGRWLRDRGYRRVRRLNKDEVWVP